MTSRTFSQDLKDFLSTHSYQEITIKNAKFKYILAGKQENPSIVFLNGLNMQEAWIKYFEAFETNYRVLMMEYPITPKTNNELLDLIAELLKRLNIKKPIIIGASDGGLLAQIYVRRFPDNINGLILITTITIDSSYVEDIKKELPASIYQIIFNIIPYSILKKKLIGKVSTYFNDETLSEQEYGKSFFETISSDNYYKKKFIHCFGLVNEMSKHEKFKTNEFESVRNKILVLHPEKDLFKKEDQDKLTMILPDPDVRYIKGGHLSFVICANEYIKIIKSFIQSL
ncbi:alpha/beta-hydrolase [Anaeromyces robustus]|uniref:Alpha/beta-hydrolase n=1 Tax=Anaeromyces robustus TaxID=1754192 RepID=A0A1Y1WZK0_9FUNG|nr:alpha/beta-hydrolase [Anaeromyces robustus]|eukprot:ORX78778.1 alpha/beta-hydrolase [Anaeromyces robustus]